MKPSSVARTFRNSSRIWSVAASNGSSHGKSRTVEEFDRGEAGIVIGRRVRIVASLPADHDVDRIVKPLEVLSGERLAMGVEVLVEECRAIAIVFIDTLVRFGDRRTKLGMQAVERGCHGGDCTVGDGRLVRPPLPLEQVGRGE